MNYRIAFFDIDGTLVNDEKKIPLDTIEAVAETKRRGVEPVIATGRAPYFFEKLAQQLGIESYVSLNGGYVVYKGKTIYQHPIPRTDVEALVRLSTEHRHSLVFEGSAEFYANNEIDPSVQNAVLSLKVDLPGYDPDFWTKADIYQVFLHCEEQDEPIYQKQIPGLRYIRWHKTAMDVLPADSSKAEGVKAMLRLLELEPEQAIAFGDGLNDKEMLSTVGLGIAMGNSHEDLLPYANYVTSHVDQGGILHGLKYAQIL
ncbi:Cof-type HAD-IIB family hydrolase [Paenibacillus aceti]|uniref:Phosphatase n=1 Tax=Paenibacillus aceti TaxID=1820010 RepID=A0ABQ1VTJ6_9BACL|nr:Cof-type HAD-IIB family hydrolase [Paenibacillus aceti]GGF98087.1 phosphatase [Paenibacillus aceti]